MSGLNWPSDNHIFEFSKEDIELAFDRPLFRDLISSKAFKRLHDIYFLGGIDYLVPVSSKRIRRNNRYQHTLAVAALAKRYVMSSEIPKSDSDRIIAAALLHDIGHAPLSHSMEPAFRKHYGVDHHRIGREIILGNGCDGGEVSGILSQYGVDPVGIIDLIEGREIVEGADIFSRSINVDTIEGIIRSSRYIHGGVFMNPSLVLDSMRLLDRTSSRALDAFWRLKNEVYSRLIQSMKGTVADMICIAYVEGNKSDFSEDDYFSTGTRFRRYHRSLLYDLSEYGARGVVPDYVMPVIAEMKVFRRRFTVQEDVLLRDVSDLDKRYTQEKVSAKISMDVFKRRGGEWNAIIKPGQGVFE